MRPRRDAITTTRIHRARNVGLWGYVTRLLIVLAATAIMGLGIYGIMR